ncbi:hypothetical protein BC937DRAFT_92609 [Endogone sp. FLAS-F59071]|nr:hypothetical protein BC937DRAFT_92609 [Endogone sp. FLAS-F59071]|eukprot:RUS21474.1 hypothetical protein BC937DRAFT_92609 [Endogone sp. FLAS-F59071]
MTSPHTPLPYKKPVLRHRPTAPPYLPPPNVPPIWHQRYLSSLVCLVHSSLPLTSSLTYLTIVSDELAQAFADAVKAQDVRVMRISIVKDFNTIQNYLEPTTPSFVLYRLDTKSPSSGEYEWLFLSYVPDVAKVRDKMLYASTRATLTKELGDYRFKDSMYGTNVEEFTLDGYKKHKRHQNADAPLTARERELAEIKAIEAKEASNAQGTTVRKTYAAGVSFPLSEQALEAVRELAKDKEERAHNFVQLHIEPSKEIIELTEANRVEAASLAGAIPDNTPRFTLFVWERELNGENVDSLVFIYTCPSASKIRERMVYSSCRASVVTVIEAEGLNIAKKVHISPLPFLSLLRRTFLTSNIPHLYQFETNDPTDLTESYLIEELHPPQSTAPTGSALGGGTRPLLGQPLPGGFKRPTAPKRKPVT